MFGWRADGGVLPSWSFWKAVCRAICVAHVTVSMKLSRDSVDELGKRDADKATAFDGRETAHRSPILRSDWSGEAFGLSDSLCPAWPFLLSHLSTPLYSCLHHHSPLRISLTGNLPRAAALGLCHVKPPALPSARRAHSDTLHQRDLARDDVRDAPPNMRCDGTPPFPLFLATPSYPRGMGAILRSGTPGLA